MKRLVIPLISLVLASFSLLTLKSIAPELVSKQLLFFILGFGLFKLLSEYKMARIKALSPYLFIILNIVLILLLALGEATRGTRGWIPLFAGLKFQPSQFAVMISLVFIAQASQKFNFYHWTDFFKLIGLITVPGILIAAQPDLGVSLVYLASVGSLVLMLKIPYKKIMSLAGMFILTTIVIWTAGLKPYQKQRITSFLSQSEQQSVVNSQLDSSSYNARQALIAVGSGKIFGRGLGFGVQSHLKFLPERQTDFIFASLAEEWGFIGASLVIMLYFGLTLFLIHVGSDLHSKVDRLYCYGLAVMIFVQTMINIGMNLAIAPITGITLPLLSYGGSSILSVMMSLAVIQLLVKKSKKSSKLDIF